MASMDEEGIEKAQIAKEGIEQLRQWGAFEVQGTMPPDMIEKIFSAGWLTGERWAERQSRERDKSTSGSHVGYREGYRDGYKDGNHDGQEAAVGRSNAPRGPPALSVESDTTFGSVTTQPFDPQLKSVLDASLSSNITEDRQTTPQETQGAATSIIDTEAFATFGQPESVDPGQLHETTSTTSQNQQPEALEEVEEEIRSSHSPASDNQHIKVEVRHSLSPVDVDGKDLHGNKDKITPSLHSKRADSLVDSVEKPTNSENPEKPKKPEKPENRLKRSREVVETVEDHDKSEHRPKKPREVKGTEGKRKRITASSLGNYVYSSEDDLDTRDLLLNTCADSLRGRTCQLGPDDQTNCPFFHLCGRGRCPYPNHHGNWVHLLPTCVSVIQKRDCYKPKDCYFGHDHPEVRLRKHSSLDALYRDGHRVRKTTPTAPKDHRKPDFIPDRPAADRLSSHYSPPRDSRSVAERSRSIPSRPAADRWPRDHSPRH